MRFATGLNMPASNQPESVRTTGRTTHLFQDLDGRKPATRFPADRHLCPTDGARVRAEHGAQLPGVYRLSVLARQEGSRLGTRAEDVEVAYAG